MNRYRWTALMIVLGLATSCGSLYSPGQVGKAEQEGKLALPAPGANPDGGSYWEVEPGVRLYHFSQGRGKPVLVIHGGPGIPPSQPWASLEPLAGDRQFVYYHQRGCGLSTRPVDQYPTGDFYHNMVDLDSRLGLGAQLADIERIRVLLGQDKLVLLGHSYGGFLALLYAREFPDHVEKLILGAPAQMLFLPQPEGEGLYNAVGGHLRRDHRPGYQAWLKGIFDFGTVFQKDERFLVDRNNAFVPFWSEATADLEPQWGASEPFDPSLTGGWVQVALAFSLGSSYDLRPELARVRVPTLLVAGDRDLAFSPASRAEYARLLPQARVVTLEGGGHQLSEAPGNFAQEVRNFLDTEGSP